MGRIRVEFEVSNYSDVVMHARGALPAEQVRRVRIEGIVDSGVNHLVLPETVARQLGLPVNRTVEVTYGDRRTLSRDLVDGALVELCARTGVYSAVVEPNRTNALIGAIIMQDLDLIVDCRNHSIAPRNPEFEMTEVE